MTMRDESTGDIICNSCPTYGNTTGLLGDEKGYVVGMGESTWVRGSGMGVRIEWG
jgi:hypothetical protein